MILSCGERHQRLPLLHREPHARCKKAGMTDKMFGELMAVTGMANETNRLANGYRIPVDPAFEK